MSMPYCCCCDDARQVWACLRTLDSFGIQHAHIVSDPSTYSKKARLQTMCTAMGR